MAKRKTKSKKIVERRVSTAHRVGSKKNLRAQRILNKTAKQRLDAAAIAASVMSAMHPRPRTAEEVERDEAHSAAMLELGEKLRVAQDAAITAEAKFNELLRQHEYDFRAFHAEFSIGANVFVAAGENPGDYKAGVVTKVQFETGAVWYKIVTQDCHQWYASTVVVPRRSDGRNGFPGEEAASAAALKKELEFPG